jgi:hypothetical protein
MKEVSKEVFKTSLGKIPKSKNEKKKFKPNLEN